MCFQRAMDFGPSAVVGRMKTRIRSALRHAEGAMDRGPLHNLIERIPETEIPAAKRFLEYLVASPALRAAQLAPIDDEPVTAADETAIAQAKADVEAGRIATHDEVLREFGLR